MFTRRACGRLFAVALLVGAGVGAGPAAGADDATRARLAIPGLDVTVETGTVDARVIAALLTDFGVGFQTADRARLTAALSPDFVWHMHGRGPDHQGETVYGVDGMLAVLAKRKAEWSELKITDLRVTATAGQVVQTARMSGVDAARGRFDVNTVDVYTIRDGKIAVKDTYWKQLAP